MAIARIWERAMTITVCCQKGHPIRVADTYAGKNGLCPRCGSVVKIPLLSGLSDDEIVDLIGPPEDGPGTPEPLEDVAASGVSPLTPSLPPQGPIARCPKCRHKVHVPANHICPHCNAYFTEWHNSIKIVVADDHEVIRAGIAKMLDGSDIEIVAEARNGAEAIAMAVKHSPDVVLLDIRMAGADGLDAIEMIRSRRPATRVVILSTYDNPIYIARAMALGASDYVLKGTSPKELIAAIRAAAAGETRAHLSGSRRVAAVMQKRQISDEDAPLTERETEVLLQVAQGLSNKEIAAALKIGVETVKEHVQSILKKIGVADRTQAALWAVRRKLI
jgi:DNA-binding NarL/FixJ family response regulator